MVEQTGNVTKGEGEKAHTLDATAYFVSLFAARP